MYILGISCYYHDAAACLLKDGKIVAAVAEEAFTRIKHDADFPKKAIAYCLKTAGITESELDFVVFYEKPFLKFERLLETYVAEAPQGWASWVKAIPIWLKKKLWIPDLLHKELPDFKGKLLFSEHHESHAASAFYASPFDRAAILTTDGVGEWATTSWGVGQGNQIDLRAEINFPHSLGLLYSAFTYFCGFKVNSGEYKLMGLAPYGEPKYVQTILDHLISVKADGSYRLNMDYFTYPSGLRMTGKRFAALFGGTERMPESPLTQREMDLARSVQGVTEDVLRRMVRHIAQETGEENLCLAGGVALNCVANGLMLRDQTFKRIWIQPASGDAGGALGAALMGWHTYLAQPRLANNQTDSQQGSYLGPAFSPAELQAFLDHKQIPYQHFPDEGALTAHVAKQLAAQKVIGWFQGRMEYGPRALGNRSILADPRGTETQKTVNLKIKFRESFRPFAPAILHEKVEDWFDLATDSPYMLLVAPVKAAQAFAPSEGVVGDLMARLAARQAHSPIPAVTHIDGSARIQTVHPETNPLFYKLLSAFEAQTNCPILVNTSFNVRGEPIVCSPEDAWRCFINTHLDGLVLGPFVIEKTALPERYQTALRPEEIAATYGLD